MTSNTRSAILRVAPYWADYGQVARLADKRACGYRYGWLLSTGEIGASRSEGGAFLQAKRARAIAQKRDGVAVRSHVIDMADAEKREARR